MRRARTSRRARSLRDTSTPRGPRSANRLRTIQLGERTPAGTAFPESAPSEEAVRAFVMAGICPFCGLGPYKLLATHTNRAHATDRRALRDLCGLPYAASIIEEGMAARISARARRSYEEGRTLTPEVRASPKSKRCLSLAAKRSNADRVRALPPEVRAANSRAGNAGRLAKVADRDARIMGLLDEGLMFIEVGAIVGMSSKGVRAVARRNGQGVDGRSRYSAKTRGSSNAGLLAGTETAKRRSAERRALLVARFDAGESVESLAESSGVTRKTMAALLRKAGAAVPDGRTTRGLTVSTRHGP